MGVVKSFVQFTMGAGIGAACGFAAARLFTPHSGQDLQHAVGVWQDNVTEAGKDASDTVKAQLENQYRQLVDDPAALSTEPNKETR